MGIDILDIRRCQPGVVNSLDNRPGHGLFIGPYEMVGIRCPAHAQHLCLCVEAMGRKHFLCRKHQHAAALGKHKALAVNAERPRSLPGVGKSPVAFINFYGGVHVGKALYDLGHKRHLNPACQHKIAVSVADHARPYADSMVTGSACPLRRKYGAGETEQHPRLARGHIGAEIRQQIGAYLQRAPLFQIINRYAHGIRAIDGRT